MRTKLYRLLDTYRHKGLRKALVSDLKQKGIKDEKILESFMNIPRHYFIDHGFAEWAYKDVPFKIGSKQTISQPYTVAKMTELLQVNPGEKILEIGTGSGFQACVLSYLGAKVYTIERQETLYKKTSKFLPSIGFGDIRCILGDGYEGLHRFAPFHKIIVTAGAQDIPHLLLDQLAIGGTMVVPVGLEGNQIMNCIKKTNLDQYEIEEHGEFVFVPFLPGVNLNLNEV